MTRRFWAVFSMLTVILSMETAAYAAANKSTSSINDIAPIRESSAFHQYLKRPVSDHSKLIYLIERFGDAPIEVLYDGHYFKAPFVAKIARWFLSRHYRKETVNQWILKWCNASVPGGNLIWVKMADGRFRLSREVLKEELALLEATMREDLLAAPASSVMPMGDVASAVSGPAPASKLRPAADQSLNPAPAAPAA